METVLRPLIVIGGTVVLTLLVGRLLDLVLRRVDAAHSETPLWGLLRRCRVPFQLVLGTALLRGSYRQSGLLPRHGAAVGHALTLVLIAAAAWLLVRVVNAAVDTVYVRWAAATPDEARVRRVRTQVTLIHRVVMAVVVVVALAAMLLTFPTMRTAGASVLASAGLLGIVAGIAAQSTLGNVFAGLQIAFGDTVRIGDTVVVDKEWGRVEEITLTFLTVRTWDERRITMPVSYFTGKPYENWSRGGAQMTGTVFLHLDHTAPVALMRERLTQVLAAIPEWDGRTGTLAVTDTGPHTMEVRAVVSAGDGDDLWTVRCAVREQLIGWLCAEHPYALPRVALSRALPPPAADDAAAPVSGTGPAG
ncbi:mechanosensitive ion channel family protein [Streptomyces antimicrobicus]|uniref:Mechanosensitive ion channel family protein n=1 Tax=Streptomyces antimicrobicus TaxID=2883108 RepID=A0ABS8B416_9ACTN|nr:mechanosensitive ion channel domain-containing protein [Streptomyces antimicrobicus]MCB5179359.1 mechanosensitive ion channel family protein [Streptomyces antimicrobicus]